jgi:hypothetical protein
MRIPGTRHLDNERGATLVFVAVALIALLSMVALAVDYGMLASARADAQRAADASALAGASTYMDALPDPVTAEERALDWAQRNQLLGNAVQAAEVSVTVDDPESTVNVLVQRTFPLFFARIFGVETAPISAFASARVTTSGTSHCIKPFGIPQGAYGDDDVGTDVLLWESGPQPSSDGETEFLLVGTTESPAGVGRDVYHMLTDTDCEFSMVEVGDEIPVQPSNNSLGNVTTALRDIETAYGSLTWSPDGPYDGFNKADYLDDPRVSIVPMYDESTYAPPGAGTVSVTGFLMVALVQRLVNGQLENTVPCGGGPNNPPCVYSSTGQRQQLWAVVLPAPGVSDTCSGAHCSDLNRVLQLIR